MSRKIYTKEFKEQAVKLSFVSGKSIAETASDLGLPVNMLHRWRRIAKLTGRVFPGRGIARIRNWQISRSGWQKLNYLYAYSAPPHDPSKSTRCPDFVFTSSRDGLTLAGSVSAPTSCSTTGPGGGSSWGWCCWLVGVMLSPVTLRLSRHHALHLLPPGFIRSERWGVVHTSWPVRRFEAETARLAHPGAFGSLARLLGADRL